MKFQGISNKFERHTAKAMIDHLTIIQSRASEYITYISSPLRNGHLPLSFGSHGVQISGKQRHQLVSDRRPLALQLDDVLHELQDAAGSLLHLQVAALHEDGKLLHQHRPHVLHCLRGALGRGRGRGGEGRGGEGRGGEGREGEGRGGGRIYKKLALQLGIYTCTCTCTCKCM